MQDEYETISTVRMGGKTYSLGHPLAEYRSCLLSAIAASTAIPQAWGDFKAREIIQELLYSLIRAVDSRNPMALELSINQLKEYMLLQKDHISGGLSSADFIQPSEENSELLGLHALCSLCANKGVAARDRLELEDRDLSKNLIYMLECSSVALLMVCSWVFSFVSVYSLGDKDVASWEPWPEDKIKRLNI